MLYFHIVCVFLIRSVLSIDTETIVLRAIRGRDVWLPCGHEEIVLDGPGSYVLWVKDDRDLLYRYPNEETGSPLNRRRMAGRSCEAGGACYDDTSLLLKRVTDQDSGQYRCRVHYQAAPSVDYVVDLRLVETVILRAVRDRDARLPCGQGKVFLDGPESYVLWVKNDQDFLYRYPNKETERLSSHDRVAGLSCDGDDSTCYDDTSLLLKKVTDQDSGQYRCSVHYQASPSVDYVVDLRLVDSPGMPRIFNGDGDEIAKGYVGPLSLGSELTLICEVNDDQPDTLVYWRRDGVVLERAHVVRPGVVRAEVRVPNVSRAELDAHYECLAQNADVTEPLIAGVVVKMYLAPLSVEIRTNNNLDFEAGQPRVVDCVVIGCKPPPYVTWHLGTTMLKPNVHKEVHDGNYTVSSLSLTPSLRDNKQELVCRALNSHLPTSVFEDRVTLNVGYRPVCVMNRDQTVGAVRREAETVICEVEASPEPLQFSWTFADSKTSYTSVTKVSDHKHRYSSTLTWLSREGDIGQLLCRATNAFGEQKRPCSYNVLPGGPPHSPECEVLRSYPNALRVQCKKAWDGGRPQIVHLEILDEDGKPLRNVSDAAGNFHLHNINEDRNLTAVVYASSVRGRSDAKVIHLETMKPVIAPAVTENAPAKSWTRWLEVTAAVAVGAVAITAVVLSIKVIRSRREKPELNPDLGRRADGSFHREPDFTREERLLGPNITVNQLAPCQNQYSLSPVSPSRLIMDYGVHATSQDTCPHTQHSYFV